jgi:hypothetical protein
MDIVKRNWEIFLNMKQSQHFENTVQQILKRQQTLKASEQASRRRRIVIDRQRTNTEELVKLTSEDESPMTSKNKDMSGLWTRLVSGANQDFISLC